MTQPQSLQDKKDALLFDVCRSIRYHDRRKAFYERLHRITNFFTILMAGSFLFAAADIKGWLSGMINFIATVAAFFAILDMVVIFSRQAALHGSLKDRFSKLEIEMTPYSKLNNKILEGFQTNRLQIEIDEPPVYKVLDIICRNELLEAEGFSSITSKSEFGNVNFWQRQTCNIWPWANYSPLE